MSFLEMSVKDFAAALASNAPTPGGGGASALVAAVGMALGSMVGGFTLGKKKYAAVEPEIRAMMDEAEGIRSELLGLIDGDAAAFEPLSRAYALPKDEPGRAETMEKCLFDAAQVPLQIMRLACRAIELQRGFAEKGSAMVVSDAGTGVVFCWSALYGAALNVKVNTKLMADQKRAAELNAEVDGLMDRYWKMAEQVYESVMGRFS